jgi:hypothetical protein
VKLKGTRRIRVVLLLRFVFVVNLCWGCLLVEEDRICVVGSSLFLFLGASLALFLWLFGLCVCACVRACFWCCARIWDFGFGSFFVFVLKEMDKQEVFTSMEPFFDFPSAEHESSNTTNVGGTHKYKSAAAGPVFDFGNNDLLPGFEFQAGVESSRSSTQADNRARRSLSPPPLVRTLFLPPPPSFSSIETFGCLA